MPVISRFFGIIIFMFWREHEPAHFHAKYGDEEIIMEIDSGKTRGTMSNRAIKLVQEWRELHKDELHNNWELAKLNIILLNIEPLE